MEKFKAFCKRKNIEVSAKRYGIDALGAMAQGLFCSLLIGTIIKTLGVQLGVPFLTDIGTYAMSVSGPAMAVAIGYALKADPMVLFSLAAVGWAANAEGGAGGPLAVLIIAILAAECGKAVSKETKIDILVTPAVTILVGVALAKWIAPTLASAITGPIATCVFHLEMNGAPINSGMGTCGLCGLIGVWTGWVSPSEEAVAKGAAAMSPTGFDWLGLILVAIVLPAILAPLINMVCRRLGWVKDGDLKLD